MEQLSTGRRLTRHEWPWWAVLCVTAAVISVTWWWSGLGQEHGPDHAAGPYALPLAGEYAVGLAAVVAAIVAVMVVARRPASGSVPAGVSSGPLLFVAGAASIATWCWRTVTVGVDGANIGAGLVAVFMPPVVSGLLCAAVVSERRSRGGVLRSAWLLIALACLTAAALFLVVWTLTR